jgi:hypothetical protein
MEMRGGEIKVGIRPRQFLRRAPHRSPIARSHSRVHHQRRAAPTTNPTLGKPMITYTWSETRFTSSPCKIGDADPGICARNVPAPASPYRPATNKLSAAAPWPRRFPRNIVASWSDIYYQAPALIYRAPLPYYRRPLPFTQFAIYRDGAASRPRSQSVADSFALLETAPRFAHRLARSSTIDGLE